MSNYTERVESNLKDIEGVSTGICPGCETCASNFDMDLAELHEAWSSGKVESEAHFSWHPCGICDSRLGGDREVWHGIIDGKIEHFDDACIDCVMYLANGDEPEEREEVGR